MVLARLILSTRFIDSEADLDSSIKSLLPLAQSPALAYPEMVRSGIVSLLVGLLSHENVDIVIDAVEVFHELTDEDVGNEGDESEQEDNQPALKILIESLVSRVSSEASRNDTTLSGRTFGTRVARGQLIPTEGRRRI